MFSLWVHCFYFRSKKGHLCLKKCNLFPNVSREAHKIHCSFFKKLHFICKSLDHYSFSKSLWTLTVLMAIIIASSKKQRKNILFPIIQQKTLIILYYFILVSVKKKLRWTQTKWSPETAEQVCDRQGGTLHLLKFQGTILNGLSFILFGETSIM